MEFIKVAKTEELSSGADWGPEWAGYPDTSDSK